MIRKYRTMIYGLSIALTAVVGFGIWIVPAHASVEFMTNWDAKTYAPAWYKGALFPTYQSFITASFELLDNGVAVDLSKVPVRWYADDTLLKNEVNGLGIKQVTIFNKKYGGDVISVKIAIPDYKGQSLETLFTIPVKNPDVVVDVPYAQKKVERGDNTLYAWPFFFNVPTAKSLRLQWTVDGNTLQSSTADNAQLLFSTGNTPQEGAKSEIEATVINPGKAIEQAVKKILVDLP